MLCVSPNPKKAKYFYFIAEFKYRVVPCFSNLLALKYTEKFLLNGFKVKSLPYIIKMYGRITKKSTSIAVPVHAKKKPPS